MVSEEAAETTPPHFFLRLTSSWKSLICSFVGSASQFHPFPVGAEKDKNEEQRTLTGVADEAALFQAFFLVAAHELLLVRRQCGFPRGETQRRDMMVTQSR
jgi:hypothetical protein